MKPGYTVEEPVTPRAPERGFAMPRGGDDELLQLIESWQGESPQFVIESFNERGEDLLESFLSRHESDFAENKEQRFREYLNALEQIGARYEEEGNATGAPKKLSHLLLTQIVPVVKTVLRAHVRQKQARGGRDRIPGGATEARDERAMESKARIRERIESEVRLMGDYNRLQSLMSQQLRGGMNVEDELNMYSAQKEVLKRKLFLWDEENQLHQGAFNSIITQLEREYKDTSTALDSSLSQLHGLGYASAQRARRGSPAPSPWRKGRGRRAPLPPDKMPGSPWRKPGAQSASRTAREREETLTRQRSQSDVDAPLGEKRSGMRVTEARIPFRVPHSVCVEVQKPQCLRNDNPPVHPNPNPNARPSGRDTEMIRTTPLIKLNTARVTGKTIGIKT